MQMKNYLSFGGGVNSVALYLHMLASGVKFEAIFVDHGADWPETYAYVNNFSEKYPLTILKASLTRKKSGETFTSLIDYCRQKNAFLNNGRAGVRGIGKNIKSIAMLTRRAL